MSSDEIVCEKRAGSERFDVALQYMSTTEQSQAECRVIVGCDDISICTFKDLRAQISPSSTIQRFVITSPLFHADNVIHNVPTIASHFSIRHHPVSFFT
jgi:hypothetical protein